MLGWLVAIALAACTYQVDEDLCLDDDHCDDDEICAANRACLACAGDACPPHERCVSTTDCDDDEVCADDAICRPRCVVDAQCPASGLCQEPVCAAALGEPCIETGFSTESTPCADTCIDTDNQLEPVPSYCSVRCLPEMCPAGYECVSDFCRIINGPLVCNHPDATRPCGSCLWEHCSSDLGDCCEGGICTDVLEQVNTCDTTRLTSDCLPLAAANAFESTSFELQDCLSLFCDEGVCIP